jgi:hypothetical protein
MSVFQVPRQQTDAPARDREGSLYKPKAEGRIYGSGKAR